MAHLLISGNKECLFKHKAEKDETRPGSRNSLNKSSGKRTLRFGMKRKARDAAARPENT